MDGVDRKFWIDVWKALQRLIALAIFGIVHHFLNALLKWAAPQNIGKALSFLEDALFVAFILVYAYLAYEMVTVFMPAIARKRVPVSIDEESHDRSRNEGRERLSEGASSD